MIIYDWFFMFVLEGVVVIVVSYIICNVVFFVGMDILVVGKVKMM